MWDVWGNDFHLLAFMFAGALWRRACDRQIGRFGLFALVAVMGLFLVGFPAFGLIKYLRHGYLHPDHVRLFSSYPIAVLIFGLGVTWLKASWRSTAWLGKISYSIYLLHPVVVFGLFWLVDRSPAGSAIRTLPLSLYLAAVAALTIPLSALTYAWVEAPLMRLGGRLTPQEEGARPRADDALAGRRPSAVSS